MIDRSVLDFAPSSSTNYLVTNPNAGTLTQQWFIHANQRIVNAENSMNMDVQGASTQAGTPVIIYRDNGGSNQEFILQMKQGDYEKDSDETGPSSGENPENSSENINKIVKGVDRNM